MYFQEKTTTTKQKKELSVLCIKQCVVVLFIKWQNEDEKNVKDKITRELFRNDNKDTKKCTRKNQKCAPAFNTLIQRNENSVNYCT